MKNEITLQTRRQFLRTTVLGSALTWTVPAFLADTFTALHSEAAASRQRGAGATSPLRRRARGFMSIVLRGTIG